jgi:flagellar hook-basal body complex protein FliE
MTIESINALAPFSLNSIEVSSGIQASESSKGANFEDQMSQYVKDVNEQINAADVNLREYAVGENTNIHEILLSVEKAKLSFELGLQVRNRLLEGYQEIMRMQV